jgi:pantothenate kinase
MLQRLLSRRSIGMAASVAGGAGAIAYLSSHSSSSEPHSDGSDARSSLSEFQKAPPMRRSSIDVSQPIVREDSPVFVGICGGTGSGKTTVAESIARRLQKHGDRVTHISHDDYYKPLEHLSIKERARQNFDHPDALDTALMVQHLAELKAGRRVNIPTCKQLRHR